MSTPTAFATPTPGRSSQVPQIPSKKRKRHQVIEDTRAGSQDVLDDDDPNLSSLPTEYSAVVSPAERSQRRLAGLPLDHLIPPAPFPHTSPDRNYDSGQYPIKSQVGKPSLKAQHLAVVSAILHRSMMHRDYARARRAMGLILRQDGGGRAVDIRNDGLWGPGAEILLRCQSISLPMQPKSSPPHQDITQDGFERCRLFYENLMIQHPPHKSWPNAVNALDFCIAMFGLWIYVIRQTSQRIQANVDQDEVEDRISPYQCVKWESEQALRILGALEKRMKDLVYRDHPELIRLQEMVALWHSNLAEDCAQLLADEDDRPSQ